jgi:hypothetical protein
MRLFEAGDAACHSPDGEARRLLPAIAALSRFRRVPACCLCSAARMLIAPTSAARCNWPSAYACGALQHAGYDDERASAGHSGIKSRADPRDGRRRAGMSGQPRRPTALDARVRSGSGASAAPARRRRRAAAPSRLWRLCAVCAVTSPRRPRAWRLSVFRAHAETFERRACTLHAYPAPCRHARLWPLQLGVHRYVAACRARSCRPMPRPREKGREGACEKFARRCPRLRARAAACLRASRLLAPAAAGGVWAQVQRGTAASLRLQHAAQSSSHRLVQQSRQALLRRPRAFCGTASTA